MIAWPPGHTGHGRAPRPRGWMEALAIRGARPIPAAVSWTSPWSCSPSRGTRARPSLTSAWLGTTTAALYYHFKSKADILETLFAEPIAAYTKLAELASGNPSMEEFLGSFIDMTLNSRELLSLVSADHSIRSLLEERLAVKPEQMIDGIVGRLAGPDPDRRALIRAHVAYAVVKDGVRACLSLNGSVTPQDRTEILEAALRVLKA